MKFTSGLFYIPKENKARPQGEDAYFICKAKNAIGIADGVGSWAFQGIDAGKYARELMANCMSVFNQNKGSINPARVLQLAYRKTLSKGSSTACIIALKDNNVLRYANLGDSGFVLFRGKKFLYQSPVQTRKFNHPYQLGSGSGMETPNLAHEEDIRVEDGDIVIVATDGLFDNVYHYEIERILDENEDDDPDKLAQKIAEYALRNSKDKTYLSPFAKAAKTEGIKYDGGKYDDITVILAKINI
ncbi:hypothetical protein M5689_025073 [Euphorbia peplus]|nr:hypothetical protein M5689_025073 [Euphorbia peplus]